ncbi:flavin reductase family protein [Desulfofundulus sp.]|uniref:flavin reductase family protein n=1 Tax=Desulfofundulus sp. TaxID=2282750 RepID=UPI003C75C91A
MILAPRKREQVMPLPVVLISTVGKDGVRNIAPWSNITPILRPFDDIILASWIKRDTLNNIRETGEFVVNVPPVDLVEAVMVCSRNYPPEVDEFEESGLKPRPSQKVKVPGIEGCLAWVECVLVEEIRRKNYALIIGKVVHLEVDDRFFNEAGEMDYERAKPLSVVLGEKGMWFTRPVFAGRYADYAEMFLSRGERF